MAKCLPAIIRFVSANGFIMLVLVLLLLQRDNGIAMIAKFGRKKEYMSQIKSRCRIITIDTNL